MAPVASSFLSLTLHCFGFVVVKFAAAAAAVAMKVKDDSAMGLAV